MLLDFGSARGGLLQTRTAQLTSLVTPGYAPIEQYGERANKQGPWTDIYGLGATLHRCITGSPPPDAINRSESIATESQDTYCPTQTITEHEFCLGAAERAIESALAFRPQDRPQSIDNWRASFEDELLADTESTKSLFTVNALTENYADSEATTNAPRLHETYVNPYQRTKNCLRCVAHNDGRLSRWGIMGGYFGGLFTETGPRRPGLFDTQLHRTKRSPERFGDFLYAKPVESITALRRPSYR